jgi:hypothetical protein
VSQRHYKLKTYFFVLRASGNYRTRKLPLQQSGDGADPSPDWQEMARMAMMAMMARMAMMAMMAMIIA